MKKIRVFFACLLCRLSIWVLRLTGRGGTAIPGKVAIKICPDILGDLAKDVRCVAVTGTNGKTTSARMIEEAFRLDGRSYFSNRSGANLINGVTSLFIENATLTGRPKKQFAIVECDEAASKEVCRLIDPEVILVTNVFRDQLDRYGEVTHTLENILTGIQNSPHATLCLNADCSLTASIAEQVPIDFFFYWASTVIYSSIFVGRVCCF